MLGSMEYKGLWEDGEAKKGTIYKVIEFYDWHNCDPGIGTTIFMDKGVANTYIAKRIKEVPYEIFERPIEELNKTTNPNGSICINNDNDYWTISIEEDEIVTSCLDIVDDLDAKNEEMAQRIKEEERSRQRWDYSKEPRPWELEYAKPLKMKEEVCLF